jgi:hypothetical protein
LISIQNFCAVFAFLTFFIARAAPGATPEVNCDLQTMGDCFLHLSNRTLMAGRRWGR